MNVQRISLIDDDEVSNFIYKKLIMLMADEIQVQEFSNADSALAVFEQLNSEEMPQIIFLDINLAGKTAWDFLETYGQLPESHRKITKIYILSSTLDERDIMKAHRSPYVNGFLGKPVSFEKLRHICEQYVEA
jgi:response regulator RpfG family c-di-GMP phosphodiesterase